MKYASVDVGTTRVKLAIYDERFDRLHFEYATVPLTKDGLQDPEELYRTVKAFFSRAREMGANSAGLATYRASVVAWKKDGTPLTPVITWVNTQTSVTYAKLPFYVRAFAKIPPLDLIISPSSPGLRMLLLQDLKPGLKGLLASGDAMAWTLESYLTYRLTGRFVSDATNATLTGLIHPKDFREIGIVKSLLKLRLPVPEVVGNAENLGMAEGVTLNALAADQQAACVSEGVLDGSCVKVTNGTGTFVDVPVEGYRTARGLVPIVVLRTKSNTIYGLEGYLPSTGRMVDSLLELGLLSSYSDLESAPRKPVDTIIPALTGLQVPRLSDAEGFVQGLGPSTDRGTLVTAILDSVAFHARAVLDAAGSIAKTVRANGALSKSTALLSRISRVTGLPVERQADLEGALRGLALLQGIGAGILKLNEVASTRRAIEVISEAGKDRLDGEFLRWKKQIKSLKSFRT